MVVSAFLNFMKGGSTIIEPFSRVLLGGKSNTRKKSNRKSKKIKKTKMRKNLSRKKATKRKNLSKKRSISKRTKHKRTKHKRTNKKKHTMKRKNRKTLHKKRKCNCDNKRSYNGTEPSPKGLGFCAHCSPVNITMKGLDGNLWVNEKYSKGKRWTKQRIDMN
tara:strand:- start:20 stop:505 length:486 start_codon:yes stop_codon:yes gene_type:complete